MTCTNDFNFIIRFCQVFCSQCQIKMVEVGALYTNKPQNIRVREQPTPNPQHHANLSKSESY